MIPQRWRTPVAFLVLASIAMPLGFAAWRALLDNFAIEQAAFTGREIGILQSLREVPGFMAFTAVFVILVLREQTFAVVAVAVFGVGVALTGYFPSKCRDSPADAAFSPEPNGCKGSCTSVRDGAL